jgi:3'-phosphoadenosine 5'-phosphosulfate sulfotransferase (PAPS reductase)/FAD synthetase
VPLCCQYLKEKPALKAYKEHSVVAVFTGVMASESRQREMLIKRYDNSTDGHDDVQFCGQRYYARTVNLWKMHPIAYWNDPDVWKYINKQKIPVNEVYSKWKGIYPRCGCLPCTAYKSWEQRLSVSHPKLYRYLKKLECPNQTNLGRYV